MSAARPTRHSARLVTVCFVTCGDRVLLVRHPPDGDRFAGRWNGVGGHVEAGEDIREAARRELREETGLDLSGLRLRGVVHESGLLGRDFVLFVFTARAESCEAFSAEGRELAWHRIADLAELPLVHDVEILLQRALAPGEPFFAVETYDGGDRHTDLRMDGVTHDRQ